MNEHDKGITPAAIVSRYAPAGWPAQAYVRIKLSICPLVRLDELVPRTGRIAEPGCGIGVLAHILAAGSPGRRIEASDLSDAKIAAARRTLRPGDRITFTVGDIREFDGTGYDAIVISDTLYLLEAEDQERVLRRSYDALNAGGVLVVKEMDRRPRVKFLVNLLQETIAVKLLRFTRGGRFHFRGADEYLRLLSSIGFDVRCVRLDAGQVYPHIAYVCRKDTV